MCNGSTLTFSPFYMGNDTKPQTDDGYNINQTWGFQINFSIPLSKKSVDQSFTNLKNSTQNFEMTLKLLDSSINANVEHFFKFYHQSQVPSNTKAAPNFGSIKR